MGKITKTLFGEKPKAGKPMAGEKFQPFFVGFTKF